MTSTLPRVYLVRHGETEWAKSGQHTGRTDIPLTPVGEQAGKIIAGKLAGLAFSRVFTSPLSRAKRTCELAGFSGEIDADLLEWHYGEFEGLKTVEIRAKQPSWDLFRDGCPGGESVAEIGERADRVVARLKGLTGNVLIFAHGHVLRVLAARWVGQPVSFAQHLLLGTAAVCALGFDHNKLDEPAIALWNS